MSKETGGPAFPSDSAEFGAFAGMSLRDYFAAKAMNILTPEEKACGDCMKIAAWSYQIADAMLAERNK